jgi:hypothetical protein
MGLRAVMTDTKIAQIVGPDGTPIEKPATFLTMEESDLLRAYQAWGEREGLQGTMTCTHCNGPMEVYVQAEIGFFCKCRVIYWKPS